MKKNIFIGVEPCFSLTPWYHELLAGMQQEFGKAKLTTHILTELPETATVNAKVFILAGETEGWLRRTSTYALSKGLRVCIVSSAILPSMDDISFVTINREKDMRSIVHSYVQAGRRKIALWGVNQSSPTDQARIKGFQAAIHELQLQLDENDIYFNFGNIQECALFLLPSLSKYDGIIISNDLYAVFLLNFLKKQGHNIPDDFYFASFGNSLLARLNKPSISTVALNYSELGKQAIKCAVYLMANPKISKLAIEIPSTYFPRESTDKFPINAVPIYTAEKCFEDVSSYNDPTLRQIAALESCLNDREKITQSLMKGLTKSMSLSDLAAALYISEGTVNYHLHKIYKKTCVSSRQELCALLKTYAPYF